MKYNGSIYAICYVVMEYDDEKYYEVDGAEYVHGYVTSLNDAIRFVTSRNLTAADEYGDSLSISLDERVEEKIQEYIAIHGGEHSDDYGWYVDWAGLRVWLVQQDLDPADYMPPIWFYKELPLLEVPDNQEVQ